MIKLNDKRWKRNFWRRKQQQQREKRNTKILKTKTLFHRDNKINQNLSAHIVIKCQSVCDMSSVCFKVKKEKTRKNTKIYEERKQKITRLDCNVQSKWIGCRIFTFTETIKFSHQIQKCKLKNWRAPRCKWNRNRYQWYGNLKVFPSYLSNTLVT